MNKELKGYLKAEAIISAAFNFFINGMVTALIYHKADVVAADPISIGIDLFITCLSICILTAFFSRASLRRTKTAGVIQQKNKAMLLLSKLSRFPVLFGIVTGTGAAVIIFILTVLVVRLSGVAAIPFGVYIALKCSFAAVFGGGVTALELYSGMCKTDF